MVVPGTELRALCMLGRWVPPHCVVNQDHCCLHRKNEKRQTAVSLVARTSPHKYRAVIVLPLEAKGVTQ